MRNGVSYDMVRGPRHLTTELWYQVLRNGPLGKGGRQNEKKRKRMAKTREQAIG